jgi:hypothetical protein
LRPHSVVDQRLLEGLGLRRAGRHAFDAGADLRFQPPANLSRDRSVTARTFLDHPLQRRDRKGHSGRLDALQIDRAHQAQSGIVVRHERQFVDRPDRHPAGGAERAMLDQLRDGGSGRRHVEQDAVGDQDGGRTLRGLDSSDEPAGAPVRRQHLRLEPHPLFTPAPFRF